MLLFASQVVSYGKEFNWAIVASGRSPRAMYLSVWGLGRVGAVAGWMGRRGAAAGTWLLDGI